MTSIPLTQTAAGYAQSEEQASHWHGAAIAMLSVRVIQGFIYWGGGSRRFIYGPQKLNPHAPTWMANKFQSAMPGALLGLDHVISFMLQHFWLLYASVILFSAAELVVGAALMAGLMTRVAAALSAAFSVVLMLMFGWQGATCIDEWTMAACNLAMGATILLAGSSVWSLDNLILNRNPGLARAGWFRWASGSLPLPVAAPSFKNLGLVVLAFVVAFDVGTYSYYRGSVVTPFHGGPVSPTKHHFTMTNAILLSDGTLRFHIYLDGGTPEAPAHIMMADLLGGDGHVISHWDTAALTTLPNSVIVNDYAYNKFKAGPYGLVAEMGAKATVSLPSLSSPIPAGAAMTLQLTDVNGRSFRAPVSARPSTP
jgi:thiosulfate dehydrogenase [quinone] large subunit